MAARLAGRDPDERQTIQLGGVIAFDGATWRYPDFLARAEAAYALLQHADLIHAAEIAEHDALRAPLFNGGRPDGVMASTKKLGRRRLSPSHAG
jgi:hypothetical protein